MLVYRIECIYGKDQNIKTDGAAFEGNGEPLSDRNFIAIADNDRAVLNDIVTSLDTNEKTLGEHVRRLFVAGLVNKKYRGKFVEHTLSPYGKTFVSFLKSFQCIQKYP